MENEIIEVDYAYVSKFRRLCEAEGVPLSETKNTRWFRTAGHEAFAGLLQFSEKKVRLKALFVQKEWRGFGFASKLVDYRIGIAKQHGFDVETIVKDVPNRTHPYIRRGFRVAGKLPNGNLRMLLVNKFDQFEG